MTTWCPWPSSIPGQEKPRSYCHGQLNLISSLASKNGSLVVQWASEISLSSLVGENYQSKTISKHENWHALAHWTSGFQTFFPPLNPTWTIERCCDSWQPGHLPPSRVCTQVRSRCPLPQYIPHLLAQSDHDTSSTRCFQFLEASEEESLEKIFR